MKAIIEKFLSRKGQIVTVEFSRPLKTRKEFAAMHIEKHCLLQARAGINYDNMNSVIEKRESGDLPAVNAGLPWGVWKVFPHIIEHKGSDYLRFATLPNGKNERSFTLNGKPVTMEEIKPFCLASEFTERAEMDVFTVKAENVKDIR